MVILTVIGVLLLFIGSACIWVYAYQEGFITLVACSVIPFFWFYFVFSNWKKCDYWFYFMVAGTILVLFGEALRSPSIA